MIDDDVDERDVVLKADGTPLTLQEALLPIRLKIALLRLNEGMTQEIEEFSVKNDDRLFDTSVMSMILHVSSDWFNFKNFKLQFDSDYEDKYKSRKLNIKPLVPKQETWTSMFFPCHFRDQVKGVTFCVMVRQEKKLPEDIMKKICSMFKPNVVLLKNAYYVFSKKHPKFMDKDGILDSRIPIHETTGTNADDMRKLGFIK